MGDWVMHNVQPSCLLTQPAAGLFLHLACLHCPIKPFSLTDGEFAGFVVVSALPNDSRYVSPASTRAASPTGSRGGSFTAKGAPSKSSQSDQSAHSPGGPADTADSGTGDAVLPPDLCVPQPS